MKRPFVLPIFLLILMTPPFAWPRGGGGYIGQGTPILTPSGVLSIERLQPGIIIPIAARVNKEDAKKATRIDRLLNFLVQTDKLWNRRLMLERARQIFMSVYLARESGNTEQIPVANLFPEVARALRSKCRDG